MHILKTFFKWFILNKEKHREKSDKDVNLSKINYPSVQTCFHFLFL